MGTKNIHQTTVSPQGLQGYCVKDISQLASREHSDSSNWGERRQTLSYDNIQFNDKKIIDNVREKGNVLYGGVKTLKISLRVSVSDRM